MLKEYYPYEYVKSVFAVDYKKLWALGYRGLIFDVDNTLVHHGDDSNEKIDRFFEKLHKMGFKTCLLSDNEKSRVERFNKNIQTLYVCDADKPSPAGYQKAVELMGVEKSRAVVLGDLVTTYKKNSLDVEDAATSFRYVSTINKMQAKIYSLDNLFLSSPFDRAVIIDDESSSPLEFALSPKAVKGFVIKLIDEVWMPNAWSKNRDQIVRNLKCCINANNPARIDVEIPDIMTSELAIVAGKYSWGFSSAE